MPPSIDLTPDFDSPASFAPITKQNGSSGSAPQRTLLLAPPSAAADESHLRTLFAAHDRAVTDLQMLDRLAAGLVTLPPAAYDLVLVLSGHDGAALISTRDVLARLAPAMRPGGRLQAEGPGGELPAAVGREAVLAGLVALPGGGGFVRPEEGAEEAVVPLRARRKAAATPQNGTSTNGAAAENGARSSAGPAVESVTVNIAGRPQTLDMVPPAAKVAAKPAGVGFVDFGDDFDMDGDDDELIDEDTLLGEEDLSRPIQQPPECQPEPGQRRRACKDCTCGLAERLEAQDKSRREKADSDLGALKLASDDLNELDFTVQGKTGSCGSCALGDAFRCASCPYIGLPAFKPGEEVRILNNIPQL